MNACSITKFMYGIHACSWRKFYSTIGTRHPLEVLGQLSELHIGEELRCARMTYIMPSSFFCACMQAVPEVPEEYIKFRDGPWIAKLLRILEIRLGLDCHDLDFGNVLTTEIH
jgi:hypothetical protein